MAASISYAADTETGNFAGTTLAELRRRYQDLFNIPPDAIAFVNGEEMNNPDYVIQDGDKLSFKTKAFIKAV